MGTFYSNCQVHSASQEAVIKALTSVLKEPAYVATAVNGWVGVYPEGGSTDPDKLGQEVSERLPGAVLVWQVYDSDVFLYTLYENGALRDEFNSAPAYFDGMLDEEDEEHVPERIDPARVQGDPQSLLPYCVPGTTPEVIHKVLHPSAASEAVKKVLAFSPLSADQYLFADHQAADLAKLLGVDETLAALDYRFIEARESDDYIRKPFFLIKTEAGKIEVALRHTKDPQPNRAVATYRNQRDSRGEPYLVGASRLCLPEAVRDLLSVGDDVNIAWAASNDAVFEAGITALMAVAGASVEHPTRQLEVIHILLDAGADVNARSETGRTALGEALRMTDWVKHQGKIDRRAPEEVLRQAAERSARVVEMLREAGATE